MATSDSELITEARALTDYEQMILSDSEFQKLVDVGKEELRAEYGDPDTFPGFYAGDLNLDRALFWFVCIAAKVKAGEIASVDISVSDLDASQPAGDHQYWFRNFSKRLAAFSRGQGPGNVNISRADNRTYEYDRPQG
jgi:hypothetical protein